jgi:3-oxoacyl-[acyl-carrier protein] reductase
VFVGGLRVARAVAERLDQGGSIALVLSSSVKQPLPGLAVSNGLRPGLAMAAKTLADELGPRGIRVNGLLPGRVDTERVKELDALSPDPAAARAGHEALIPLRRYGQPAEFGRIAAFLLSPASDYLTGVMLPVDGGLTRAL